MHFNFIAQWRACFYLQIFFLLVSAVLLILTPDKFFSKNYRRSDTPQDTIEEEYEIIKSNIDKMNRKTRARHIKLINRVETNKYGRPSEYSMFSLIDESEEGDKISYISILFELLQNRVYVFTMLGICCLLFIVTGIQFWISDYMQTVLHIDPKKVFISFAVVSITAPVLGVIAGGYLIQKLGGYTNKTALIACFKISVLAALSGMFLSIIDNFPLFIILMWLLLFFGASIVPGLTGIMLSSTPEKTKEIANSITHLCYNLLGYLPSPFLYGLVCKYTGGPTSRYGLAFILLFSYFGVFFLYLAKYYKTKPHEKKPSKESPFELNVSTTPSKESTHDTSDYSNAYKMEVKAVTLTALYGRLSI